MSVPEDYPSNSFLRWEVKPIWKIAFPSKIVGEISPTTFDLYGVDRGALDITRNWEKINSVEQFNQGFAAKPTDLVFTIAIKEKSTQFEKFRRLSKSAVYFDVTCDILRRKSDDLPHGDNQHGFGSARIDESKYVQWLDGFEVYEGCLVNREGSTVELATIPVREFEIVFLRHNILPSISGTFNTVTVTEGDGSYPTTDELVI